MKPRPHELIDKALDASMSKLCSVLAVVIQHRNVGDQELVVDIWVVYISATDEAQEIAHLDEMAIEVLDAWRERPACDCANVEFEATDVRVEWRARVHG